MFVKMICITYFVLLLICFHCLIVNAWPDGAPCLRSVMENMNPLEAIEHEGGLQVICISKIIFKLV